MPLVSVAAAAIGLILLVAFIAVRLLRSRTAGMSIRMQVFLALAAIIGAFAFGLGLLVLNRIEARATLLAKEAARDEAHALSRLLEGEMEARSLRLADIARTLEREQPAAEVHLMLLDPSGGVLFPRGAAPHEPGTVTMDAPIVVRQEEVGFVRVVKPTIVMRRLLADFAPTVLVISLVLGAAAALSAAMIGRVIATPIEALTRFAERVSTGERGVLPPVAQGREVHRLVAAIDSMRRELEGRPFLESFAADLSHELKNPVAAVRASAEVLDEGAIEEPEEARKFVRRIREATARIEALLGEILALARIEARGVEEAKEVDLGALARDSIDAAADRGARLRLTIEGSTRVRGQALFLSRAIDNLVDNAIVHGGAGRPVHIAIRREGAWVRLSVTSEGVVAKHIEQRLFRRFVTTRGAAGGTGLGLAIVRAIAESHGGKAELVSAGPPQVELRLSLPAG